MAIKPFNSDDGFSVGNTSIDVIYANGDITTGNITVNNNANLGSVSNITITGGNANYVIQTDGQGNLSWANTSIASGVANGTSNISIPVANGNIQLTSNGNTTLTITPIGANITGNANISGNANVANLSTTGTANVGTLAVTGNANISGNATVANLSTTGTANVGTLAVTGNANISGNANVGNLGFGSGNITGTGNITAGNIIGSLANGTSNISIPVANGNIQLTSNGNTTLIVTPEGANVQGNFIVSKYSNLGNIGNITITGGSANYVIQTDGQGNLSWADAGGAASISNGNSNINIPVANGNIDLTSNGNTSLTVTPTGVEVQGNVNVDDGFGINSVGNVNITADGNTTLVITPEGADVQGNINVLNGFSVNGFYGNAGQFLTANGNNGFNWQSHFFTGNVPPEAPIPGDIWYYVDDTAVPPTNVLYMWIFDGTSEYFYDFLPPTFLNT